jgi:excisionase family DNA binding protein
MHAHFTFIPEGNFMTPATYAVRSSNGVADHNFEPLLTYEEAAAHLRIHAKTLHKLARAGAIPCIRMGKYWRFNLSALDAWLRARENDPSQPFRVKKQEMDLEIHT